MNPFRIAIRNLTLLLGFLVAAGIETVAGQVQPSQSAITQAVDVKVQTQPMAYRVDLRPEVEPSMFQGIIEAIDPSQSSITIRTDLGRTFTLFNLNCQSLNRLRQGDRVFLEPDVQGTLTVSLVDRPVQDGSRNLEPRGQVVWSSDHCAEGSL